MINIKRKASATGGGDVTKVGTPVNNQVGVWTGDGTIEGDVDLTWDTATNTLGVGLVGLDARVQVHAVKSDASDGLLLEASDGTDVGLLGVANTANVTWYGNHNFDTATQDTIAGFTGVGKTLGSLALATYPSLTELSYVKGVTSAIQTQLNAKQASDTQLTSLAGLSYASNALKVVRVNAGETDFELATITGGSNTAVDSTQSVYNNYELDFTGSGATATGDTWNVNGTLNAATRWNGKLFRVTFGSNTDITQFLPGNIGASSAFLQFGNGKDIYVSFNAKFSSASGQIGIGIADSTDVFYNSATSAGKMIFTYNGTTLYALSGETSNQQTDVGSGITRTNWNNYRIHYRYGTDVRFYINNTLVATHTTNLPTSSNNARFGIGGATSGNTAELANVVISVEQ